MEIKMKNYELSMSKAATVAAAMDKMPIYQTVRGAKQWSADKREQLVKDIAAGLYVPPIVYGWETDDDGNRYMVIDDGQQRCNAIAEAVKAGTLDPETPVLIAIDNARTGSELFRVLNIGVPVGSALVTAVSLEGMVDIGVSLIVAAETIAPAFHHERMSHGVREGSRSPSVADIGGMPSVGKSAADGHTHLCHIALRSFPCQISEHDFVEIRLSGFHLRVDVHLSGMEVHISEGSVVDAIR